MKFWDASAIVPLILEEDSSRACRALLRGDPLIVVWTLTQTEVLSALWRRHRNGGLDREAVRRAEARLQQLALRWDEMDALIAVRERAERLLRLHRLRAAVALQLGAALLAVDDRARHRSFVALDESLLGAAEREGFTIIRPAS